MGHMVCFGGDENVILHSGDGRTTSEYTKTHFIVYFSIVNSMVCEYTSIIKYFFQKDS